MLKQIRNMDEKHRAVMYTREMPLTADISDFEPLPCVLYIYRQIRGNLLWGFAHAIREAKKSHNIPVCKRETEGSWWYKLVWV